MTEVLRIRARVAAAPGAVHAALTSGAALREWLAESAEVDLAARRFEFWGRHTPQGERGRQRLVAVEPDASLVFGWPLDGRPTTVTIRLHADGAGTVLDLEQDGQPTMAELMAPPGRRDGLHSMHTFWPLAIANLTDHVEGRPLTPKADFTAGRANEVRVGFDIAAPPEQVWASLIDPQEIERWFGWAAEVEPHVGGRMGVGVDGKIFEFEPPRSWSTATPGAPWCGGSSPARKAAPGSHSSRAATPTTSGTTPRSTRPAGSPPSPSSGACTSWVPVGRR